jgi:hypothetical protein
MNTSDMLSGGAHKSKPKSEGLHVIVLGEEWAVLGLFSICDTVLGKGDGTDSRVHMEIEGPFAMPILYLGGIKR